MIVGIDVGGTNARALLVDPSTGSVHGRGRASSGGDGPALVRSIVGLVDDLRGGETVDAVGLGIAGLADRTGHRPAQLSGGEQQRVAIVRAIANVPRVVLADEPTGNLDPETSGEVFAQLRRIIASTRIAALVATHNHDLARQMDRIVALRGGKLVEVG